MCKRGVGIVLVIILFFDLVGCGVDTEIISANFEPDIIVPYTDQKYEVIPAGGYFICQDPFENLYVLTIDGNMLWGKSNCQYINCLNGILVLRENNKLIRMHILGSEIDDTLYPADYIPKINLLPGLTPAKEYTGKYGYLTQQGLWHIQPQFISASLFSDGYAFVCVENNAILNDSGSIFPSPYISDSYFHDGRLLVKALINPTDGYSYNYITEAGTPLIGDRWEYPYEDALDFSEGCAAVKSNGFWGYIDTNGKVVVDFQYLQAYSYVDGIATVVTCENKVTQIDTLGNILCEPVRVADDYVVSGSAHGGCYPVKTDTGQYNLIDRCGNCIFNTNYAYISWTGVWNLLKNDGESYDVYFPTCAKTFRDVSIVTDYNLYGHVIQICNKNGRYQLIDQDTGDVLVAADYMFPFSEGLACTFMNGRWGYIDETGHWAIAPTYRSAEPFVGGMANTDKGLIANPLIYGEHWDSDPLARAFQLGLYDNNFDLESKSISYIDFLQLVEKFFDLIEELEHQGIYTTKPPTSSDELYSLLLAQLSPSQPVTMHDTVSKQFVAMIIMQMADVLGQSTNYYYVPYVDLDTALEEYKSSIAYCSAFGLFDTNDLVFEPQKKITAEETVKCMLSFFNVILSEGYHSRQR